MSRIVIFILIISSCISAQQKKTSTKWLPLDFLIGKWEGKGTGKWGESTIIREYGYLMGGTYIIGKNISNYEKQSQNPEGEIHDNWDIISYDKGRKKYVLRQFHAEDITNKYATDSSSVFNGKFEFESEEIENFRSGWKAKEVYIFENENSFVEIFYLSAPGKDYSEYVRNTFKRLKK